MNKEIEVLAPSTEEETYLMPDAQEKIEQMLRARQYAPRNRKERRALQKKMGKTNYAEFMAVAETAKKLDYIDLITKLRELKEKKEKEDYEATN